MNIKIPEHETLSKICPYCHPNTKLKGPARGKRLVISMPWWNYRQERWQKRAVYVDIMSPENKSPRLRASIRAEDGYEVIFKLGIRFCPFCKRPLCHSKSMTSPCQFHDNNHVIKTVEYWDWIRKTHIRKQVSTRIITKNTLQLQSKIDFRENPTTTLRLKIACCPFCGDTTIKED